MSKSFLFVLLIGLALAFVNQAQDQSGFINIDCGIPASGRYVESTSKLNYISDASFINSGISKTLLDDKLQEKYQRQLLTLRSFPLGIRNCYKINVIRGSRYLIRAAFLYGNYDDLNNFPIFDLYFGANLWDTVQITDASNVENYEIINIPTLDYVQICLVNTSLGTPFISSIELRPLNNDTYVTKSGSLALWKRVDLGSTETYSYPDDVYDRIWSTVWDESEESYWKTLNVSIPSGSLGNNDFQPAEIVMSTLVTPANASAPLKLSWAPPNTSNQYYVYMHFAELQKLAQDETRSFNIILNGQLRSEYIVPSYMSVTTTYTVSAISRERFEYQLVKTENSTLPPILNAIEIYIVKEFPLPGTDQEDFDAITSIQSTYGLIKNWQGDPCSPVEFLWDGLNCTYDVYNFPRITTLNLSSSGLTGKIDPAISNLTMLEKLDLSNNSLNGEIPDFLSQLQFLKILNIENNYLTGSLPSELIEKSKNGTLSISMNQKPSLCDSPPCTNNQNNNNNKSKNATVPVVASICGILIFLAVVAVLFWIHNRKKPKNISVDREPNYTIMKKQKRQYSYSDVIKITNNFERVLGKGGFGIVYLGFIDDIQVAVKMLSPSSVHGYQQFQAEVKLLLTVHHRNLTSLIGYCNDETNKGLIYEYMANGNLQEHLSGKHSKSKFLIWEDRLRISLDAAQGLEYLHDGCKPPIIHRDIKSTNILLNEYFQAKISDFGLSKTMKTTDEITQMSTLVGGTPGYMDPEFTITNRITDKSDIYSFGVVLLEVITNQQPVIAGKNEMIHISQWVNYLIKNGDIKKIVSPKLDGKFDINSAWKAVEIAMACVSENSKRRPTMSEVVIGLKECLVTALSQTNQSSANATGLEEKEMMNLSIDSTPLAR